jgi:N-acetylglucosamine-6-sulfatase
MRRLGARERRIRRRSRIAALVVSVVVFSGVLFLPSGTTAERDPRWNFIVIVTDDQTADSIPHDPPVMPYLQAATADPNDHWVVFSNGFVNTPLCCPSRATMLTGLYTHNHGVLTNEHGHVLDEASTIAAWLHDAGYHTGLVGKYLNQYPFGRQPFVPNGWDLWRGKEYGPVANLYYDYTLIQQDVATHYGRVREHYATDMMAQKAVEFISDAPLERPFLLWFAPTAPHPPWVTAPRHEGIYGDIPVTPPPGVGERNVSDKPAWVQALPRLGPAERAGLTEQRRRSYETLVAVDDAVRTIVEALQARGDLDRTVIVFISDNSYSFGEHRWIKKSCAYDACVHVPFLIRHPLAEGRIVDQPVSAVDVAPTIAALAGLEPPVPLDGTNLAPALTDPNAPLPARAFAEWVGDEHVPGWWLLRTRRFAYVELVTGERELYDLQLDPYQLWNAIEDPAYASTLARLQPMMAEFRSA